MGSHAAPIGRVGCVSFVGGPAGARHHHARKAWATGHMAGSGMHRGLAANTIATACCFHLCGTQAGPPAGAWLTSVPSGQVLTMAPTEMQIALLRRLRLPLPLTQSRCGGRDQHGCGGTWTSDRGTKSFFSKKRAAVRRRVMLG